MEWNETECEWKMFLLPECESNGFRKIKRYMPHTRAKWCFVKIVAHTISDDDSVDGCGGKWNDSKMVNKLEIKKKQYMHTMGHELFSCTNKISFNTQFDFLDFWFCCCCCCYYRSYSIFIYNWNELKWRVYKHIHRQR